MSIRVHGLASELAHAAIDAAFAEIALVHALMSFHEEGSDVSRLNREAHLRAICVDPRTYEVIGRAVAVAALCNGAFDVTIAPTLVARGILPHPRNAPDPGENATWRDIVLLPDSQVRFRRPLWIDLGGIAKGYAVDRAIEAAMAYAPVQVCANAGGDLRIAGPITERVKLRLETSDSNTVPVIELASGSLASSCGAITGGRDPLAGPHVETRPSQPMRPRQFVSVAAPRCVDADALTKVVMALGTCSASILAALSAQAVVHDAQFGWRSIQGAA